LGLKRKRKQKKKKGPVSRQTLEGERYFHRGEKEKETTAILKSLLDIFLKRSIQTSVQNSNTVTYKRIVLAENPAQIEFNCSGQSDYYIDLNSVCLLLSIKLVKTDGSDTKLLIQTTLYVSTICCM